jgi:hypothetical protein
MRKKDFEIVPSEKGTTRPCVKIIQAGCDIVSNAYVIKARAAMIDVIRPRLTLARSVFISAHPNE